VRTFITDGEQPVIMSDSSPRAQSETLGVVLLLGLTIAGTGLIVAYGSTSLDDSKRATELDSAANAMAQLDSKASLVGIGEADAQEVSLGIDGDEETIRRTKSGWMRVEVNLTNGGTVEVMDQSLGAVVYERGETTIAYQGGGVWRASDSGATMVSPPEVHYRDTTLTLPLVVVHGEDALDGDHLELTKNGSAAPKFPVAAANRRNPLADATVNVTVKSAYYRAWGRFFEQRTGGSVEYDHAAETVTLTLVTPTKAPTISHALAATSSEQLVIAGGGSTASFTDSYNSTDGPYADTEGQNGTISTVGGAKLTGKANVRGDLVTGGGVVKVKSGNSKITGNLSYGGTKSLHKHAAVGGWVADNGSIAEIDPVTSMVNSEVRSTAATNDNDETSAIQGTRLDPDASSWTLTNGEYYLDELSLNGGEELVVDLGNGSVDLVVDDDIAV